MALRKEWVSQVKDANEVDEHIIIAIAALLTMETALAGDLTTVSAVKANWPDQLLDSLLRLLSCYHKDRYRLPVSKDARKSTLGSVSTGLHTQEAICHSTYYRDIPDGVSQYRRERWRRVEKLLVPSTPKESCGIDDGCLSVVWS
jgi:hypothetical protein